MQKHLGWESFREIRAFSITPPCLGKMLSVALQIRECGNLEPGLLPCAYPSLSSLIYTAAACTEICFNAD